VAVELHFGRAADRFPHGSGLVGRVDCLAVLDGRLEIDTPPGGGTRLTAPASLTEPTAGWAKPAIQRRIGHAGR